MYSVRIYLDIKTKGSTYFEQILKPTIAVGKYLVLNML